MPDEAHITDLCHICYENKPKYRCPRCQTKTCSLPCTQKHKQRAACNGVRNPAEYLKRSQLATPVGIDRDYNYLKSIERSIDVAGRECEQRGVDVVERAATKSLARARHPESALRKYLIENRIDVRHAPTGMSRQKSNQTRSTKRHQIVWTVEWIDASGQKATSDSCAASSTIRDLYALKQLEASSAMKRKPGEHARDASKRRRKAKQAESSTATVIEHESTMLEEAVGKTKDVTVETSDAKPETTDKIPETKDAMPETADAVPETTDRMPEPQEEHSSAKADLDPSDSGPVTTQDGSASVQDDVDPALEFYLLRPETNTRAKVLVPLSRHTTLTNALQDRTVLEYPTIYVLPHDATSLPETYMLETQYLKARQLEDQELKEAVSVASKSGVFERATRSETAPKSAAVDANSILNSLRRDLTR